MPTTAQRTRSNVRPRASRRWRLLAVATVAATGLGVAACGGAPSASRGPSKSTATDPTTATRTQSATDSTTSTTAPPITTPTVALGGKSVTVPTDDGTPITPLQDSGQNAIVTTKGVLPRVLYAARTTPVVYTNLTPRAVTVTFPHSPASPPATIAPGGSYSYTPRSMQYEYTTSTGYTGYVVVGAFTS